MIAVITFTGYNYVQKSMFYDTETPDLVESAKRITELCKFYTLVTGYPAQSDGLTRDHPSSYYLNRSSVSHPMSREFFALLLDNN